MKYQVLFIFLLTLCAYWVERGTAMITEEIIGGYPASAADFKYHAAIVGKYNTTTAPYLLCSAGIISHQLLMSAARCFIHGLSELKKFTFFAVIGADYLKPSNILLKEIAQIYTFDYNSLALRNDLAITRLKKSLHNQSRLTWAPFEMPLTDENFHGQTGVVTGFGTNLVDHISRKDKRQRLRLSAKNVLRLTHANVTVISDGQFRYFTHTTTIQYGDFNDIYGVMEPDNVFPRRGVCRGDNGAPLVIKNKVVGISILPNVDCDDTLQGSIYTKVSNLKHFVDALLEGRDMEYIRVYDNPPHKTGPKNFHKGRLRN